MKPVNKPALLNELDPEVHSAIEQAIDRYNPTHLVLFRNQDISSRLGGHCFVIGVGPRNTIKSLQQIIDNGGSSLVQPPTGYAWQYYAELYCEL